MRIGIVGLSIETMLSSPVVTGLDAVQHYSAEDLRDGDVWLVRGMLARLNAEPDAEAVPLYWATALPGGAMTAEAYAAVKNKTLRLIKEQGPFDGILIANHGALEVEGLDRTLAGMATYHPSFLLRTPARKGEAWRDLLALQSKLKDGQ